MEKGHLKKENLLFWRALLPPFCLWQFLLPEIPLILNIRRIAVGVELFQLLDVRYSLVLMRRRCVWHVQVSYVLILF